MADSKITGLTADTAPSNDDLVTTVNDPGGTPANRKVTIANLLLPIVKPNSDGTTVTLDIGTTNAGLISGWASNARFASQNGAANNPSYQFGGGSGSTFKGMYSSATADIGFSTSSTFRFRIADAGVMLGASDRFQWSSTALGSGITADTGLGRNGAGVLEVNSGTNGTYRDIIARSLFSAPSSTNGQSLSIQSLTELLTVAASATSTTTIQKPAGAIILAVSVRVTVAITCTSVFEVGDSGSANRFNTASVSKAANTTNAGTKAGAYYNATAEGIIITPDTTPTDATGRVRVTIFYILSTPPTS